MPRPRAALRAVAAFAVLLSAPVPDSYTDTFTDASSTTLASHVPDAGGTWTRHPSYATFAAISDANRARSNGTSFATTAYYWSGTPASADYATSADAYIATAKGYAAVLGRVDTSAETYYFVRLNQTAGIPLELGKIVAGTETVLGTYNTGAAVGSTHRIGWIGQGNLVGATYDGSLVLSKTDASIAASGKAGIKFSNDITAGGNAANIHLDKFLAFGPVPSGFGDPPAFAAPMRQPGSPRRASASAYLIAQPSPAASGGQDPVCPGPTASAWHRPRQQASGQTRGPLDAGVATQPAVASLCPDAAPRSSHRAAAYAPSVAPPLDQGVITQPPISALCPDAAIRPAPRPAAYLPGVTPPSDPGVITAPVFPSAIRGPDPWPRRSAAYQWEWRGPADAGVVAALPPIAAVCPAHASAHRRSAAAAYAGQLAPTPVDAGISGLLYRVYVNDHAGGPIDYTAYIAQTAALTWTSSALTYAADYRFGVRVFDPGSGLEERNVDAVIRLRLDGLGVDVTATPDPPLSLTATPVAGGGIRLDWAYQLIDPARAPAGFRIYAGTGGVPSYGATVATAAYSRGTLFFSATVTGLVDGLTYTFGVRACNAAAEETNVLTASATADATPPPQVYSLSGTSIA